MARCFRWWVNNRRGVPSPSGRRKFAVIGALALLGLTGIGLAVRASGDDGGAGATSTTATQPQAFLVELVGPEEIDRGVLAVWNVNSPEGVAGVWTLNGPVQPEPNTWVPGNWFQGTWNVQGNFTLTLTATNADGEEATDSITFTVK